MPKTTKRQMHDHSPAAIADRLAAGPGRVYLKDFVYGAIDGAVTTLAVVSGVAGGGLAGSVIIVLGLANIFADGFSMAISNYLGTRAESQRLQSVRAREEGHIDVDPDGEREEVRQIYARKGFSGQQLEEVVGVITSERKRWVDAMVQEEYGLSLQGVNAGMAGLVTFIAFLLSGSLPLIPFLLNWWREGLIADPYSLSIGITMLAFFAVGAMKGRYVEQSWYRSGFETAVVGGVAALLAYGVGLLLGGLVT